MEGKWEINDILLGKKMMWIFSVRVCVCVYTDISYRVLNIILSSHLLGKHFHRMSTVIKRKKVLEIFFQTKCSRYLYYKTFYCQCHYELLTGRHKDVVHSTLNRLYFEN